MALATEIVDWHRFERPEQRVGRLLVGRGPRPADPAVTAGAEGVRRLALTGRKSPCLEGASSRRIQFLPLAPEFHQRVVDLLGLVDRRRMA